MQKFLQGFGYQSRHAISGAIPPQLGSMSLGYSYSDRTLKVYITKRIGQAGVVDVNVSNFIEMWRYAIVNRVFTPELVNFFQNVTNELMPGYEYDIGAFNWFIRPHIQNTKIGFAIIGTYTISILADVIKMKELSDNWCESHPTIGNFGVRRATYTVPNIGDIITTLFISIGSTTRCTVMLGIKFLFNPSKIDSKTMDLIKKNMSINRLDASDADSKSNIIINTDSCRYRVPFLCLWTMFVSSIFLKSRIKTQISKL
eukprot:95718_1